MANMIAAHRDQENRVRGQRVPVKQYPKTPGARYPKTPLDLSRHDENKQVSFITRSGGFGKNVQESGKSDRRGLVTPMDTRPRAPLGDKTTNAKARPNQSAAVKDRVQEIEKAQFKSTVSKKPRQRSAEVGAPKFTVQADKEIHEDQPEYAPPPPTVPPYESDVIPRGGLTFEGLRAENLFTGYYEHAYDFTDDAGVSRREKSFKKEMEVALDQAIKDNERHSASFDWNGAGSPKKTSAHCKRAMILPKVQQSQEVTSKPIGNQSTQSVASRRAASALAIRSDVREMPRAKTNGRTHQAKRHPFSHPLSRQSQTSSVRQTTSDVVSSGEAASRTTLGYNKGKTASSLVHHRRDDSTTQSHNERPAPQSEKLFGRALSPASSFAIGNSDGINADTHRPKFMSIFDDYDNTCLAARQTPATWLDDEEIGEEFVLRLDI